MPNNNNNSDFIFPVERPERPTLFRDAEIEFALDVLGKTRLRNLLLVGPAGCGKTHLVREIASRSPGYAFRELSISLSVAGQHRVGDYEKRITSAFVQADAEQRRVGKPIVLFADEADLAFGAGSTHAGSHELDFVGIAKPYLSSGRIILWAAVTDYGFQGTFARDPAALRRFTPLHLRPLTPVQTMEVLRGMGRGIPDPVLSAAINLSRGTLPDCAIDLLDLSISHSARVGEALTPELVKRMADALFRCEAPKTYSEFGKTK